METLPMAPDGLLGASCTLGEDEMRQRLAEWRALRDRAEGVVRLDDGVRLELSADEPMEEVARLAAAEAGCCAFYRFEVEIRGPTRSLTIDAGPGNGEAVVALLGLS